MERQWQPGTTNERLDRVKRMVVDRVVVMEMYCLQAAENERQIAKHLAETQSLD